jgi:hypothetical protein
VADSAALAAPPRQQTHGEPEWADGGGAGNAGEACATAPVVEPGLGLRLPGPSPNDPGVAVLAVIDPPGPSGSPGRACFAPGLTQAQRREILFDLEWFDVRVRRREALKVSKAKR